MFEIPTFKSAYSVYNFYGDTVNTGGFSYEFLVQKAKLSTAHARLDHSTAFIIFIHQQSGRQVKQNKQEY